MQEPISGRYRLQQRLRRGGMSDVYLAYDELMQRDRAIKRVSSDNTENIHRFHREIQAMSKISHDHILPTLDDGTHGSYHYLVMPYMRRGNLRERIAQASLTQEEAGNILAQLASARNYSGKINGEECFQAESKHIVVVTVLDPSSMRRPL